MANILPGSTGSASVINSYLSALSGQGQQVLDSLLGFKELELLQYQNIESYINSRRVLADRIPGAFIPLTLSAKDFGCIDQGLTTGTVRADSGSVTTKEMPNVFAMAKTISFTSTGSIASIDSDSQLFQVTSPTVPTGQFDIVLDTVVDSTLVSFDVLSTPGNTVFQVWVSADNLTFTQWTQVSVNGYRVVALGENTNTKYVRVVIIPEAPDLLSGNVYSFGLTSLSVRGSQFSRRGQLVTRAETLAPIGASLYFGGTQTSGINYYLSLSATNVDNFVETSINTVVGIPGAVVNDLAVTSTVSGSNIYLGVLPANYYPSSLTVYETTSGTPQRVNVALALSPTDPAIGNLTKDCCVQNGNMLQLLSSNPGANRTFNVSYATGPSLVYVKVKVVIDSSSYGTSPVFNQVYFEAV